jgi:uncharacterized protein YprB with RNaseH-like and TPR domain
MSQTPQDRLKRLQRLSRLGLQRGVKHIRLPPPKPRPTEPPINTETIPLHFLNYEDDLQHAAPIEAVIPGAVIENAHGQYFSFEARYPLTGLHGQQPLLNLLHVPMSTVVTITKDEAWLDLSWRDVLFIDLETTGLEIAAGTVAFLIGIGYLDRDDFVVRQVFMRDFNEEVALLHDLHEWCERFGAVVSFNGKTFDLPLLENRFVLARLFPDLLDNPHLDLLHPARRLWRRRLENCKLATLEAEVLGVERTQADIPGHFIPSLYRKYLVDHDARLMAGIFYHNEVDIVSLATLTATLSQHLSLLDHPDPVAHFHPVDILSVGLWQQHLGDLTAAEDSLKLARSRPLPPDLHAYATTELAYLLKRQTRYAEAEPLWQELALDSNPFLALEELAKYYEWHCKDFEKAMTCISYARQLLNDQPQTWQTKAMQTAWEHRKQRVRQKLEKRAS